MITFAFGTDKYQVNLHGHDFVCAESSTGERYWWDLLQLNDKAEPAFVKQFPHTNLPRSVYNAVDAAIETIKGKRRCAQRARGVKREFLHA